MEEIIKIIRNPFESGLLTFFAGVLSILALYHFALYFQQKVRSYLYYSLFVFFVLLSSLRFGSGWFDQLFKNYLWEYRYFLTQLTSVFYLLFAYSFLEMKRHAPLWNKYVIRANFFYLAIATLLQFVSFFAGGPYLREIGYSFFVIYMPVLAILSYYPLLTKPIPLKMYLIVGSLFLFLGWMGMVLSYHLSGVERFKLAAGIFLICGILENLLFSLGLGHKQKLILKDNERSHRDIINQLKENDRLRKEIQLQLEKNLELLSQQAEKEKLEKIKVIYEREMAELKIAALNNQMNPHFIFNSLNAIKLYIIDNDKENAVHYLNKFSKLIRRILATARIKEISLSEELEIIGLYVSIENIRFQNEIDFSIQTAEDLNTATIKLPSLILQPFLENSIWHGLPGVQGPKKICLEIEKESENHLKISITDNGIGRKKSAELRSKKVHRRQSLGIKITEERLRNFSNELQNTYNLKFIDNYDENLKAKGTSVVLKLPLR